MASNYHLSHLRSGRDLTLIPGMGGECVTIKINVGKSNVGKSLKNKSSEI